MYHSHSRDLDYFTLRNGRMFVWFSYALPHAMKLSAKYAIILSYPIISYHILSITASRLPGLPNVEILVLHCSWKCCVALACWRLWVASCVTAFYHSFCVAMWVFHSAVPYCISGLILTKSKSICFQLQYIHVRNCRNFRVTTLLNWARPLQPGCSLESAGFDPEELHRRLHGETWLQCVFDVFTTKCGSEPLWTLHEFTHFTEFTQKLAGWGLLRQSMLVTSCDCLHFPCQGELLLSFRTANARSLGNWRLGGKEKDLGTLTGKIWQVSCRGLVIDYPGPL